MLFDAHKLDISDEFRNVIDSLKGNDDKIRCILNKADQVDRQKLMRVYGALMWSLGKVVKTPEGEKYIEMNKFMYLYVRKKYKKFLI